MGTIELLIGLGGIWVGVVIFFVLWRNESRRTHEQLHIFVQSNREGFDRTVEVISLQFEKTANLISAQHKEQTVEIVKPLRDVANGVRDLVKSNDRNEIASKVNSSQ